MEKILVEICQGMTCFMMGAAESLTPPERPPLDWRDRVAVRGVSCLRECAGRDYDGTPYVIVNGEVVPNATRDGILELLEQKLAEPPYTI